MTLNFSISKSRLSKYFFTKTLLNGMTVLELVTSGFLWANSRIHFKKQNQPLVVCLFWGFVWIVLNILYLLTWRIWWAPNNASKGQMGFNLVFKELIHLFSAKTIRYVMKFSLCPKINFKAHSDSYLSWPLLTAEFLRSWEGFVHPMFNSSWTVHSAMSNCRPISLIGFPDFTAWNVASSCPV
jgi:hypothetical protein